MELDAVHTFVIAGTMDSSGKAAATLSITPQIVAKRIATVEKDLDVRLFTCTAAWRDTQAAHLNRAHKPIPQTHTGQRLHPPGPFPAYSVPTRSGRPRAAQPIRGGAR